MIFGPHLPAPAADGSGTQRTRADAITVTAELDEVARSLSSATNGWAEFLMQMSETATARVYINAQAVRYLRSG